MSSIKVSLPDGSVRELPAGSTARDLAQAIGPGLLKAALAARVNGQIMDLGRELPDGVQESVQATRDRLARMAVKPRVP